MQELEILLPQQPFPHAVIKNFYTEEELSLIWKELDFFTSPDRMVPSSETGSFGRDPLSNIPTSNSHSVAIENFYVERECSDILRLNRKTFYPKIIEKIVTLNPVFLANLKRCNHDITKIKYYETGHEYAPHQDDFYGTFLTYFFKQPKSFTGGNLYFPDFDYTIPIENNMVVFFHGSVWHQSTSVTMTNNTQPFSGYGKYCMTQFLDWKRT